MYYHTLSKNHIVMLKSNITIHNNTKYQLKLISKKTTGDYISIDSHIPPNTSQRHAIHSALTKIYAGPVNPKLSPNDYIFTQVYYKIDETTLSIEYRVGEHNFIKASVPSNRFSSTTSTFVVNTRITTDKLLNIYYAHVYLDTNKLN